jgi:hypothetical protein
MCRGISWLPVKMWGLTEFVAMDLEEVVVSQHDVGLAAPRLKFLDHNSNLSHRETTFYR